MMFHHLISAKCFLQSWWREEERCSQVDLLAVRAGGEWDERKERHHPTAQMAICQFVSNPQPSHLLHTVSARTLASKWICHYVPFPSFLAPQDVNAQDECTLLLFTSAFSFCATLSAVQFSCLADQSASLSPSLQPCSFPVSFSSHSADPTPPLIWHVLKLLLSLNLTLLWFCLTSEGKNETSWASLIGQERRHPLPWLAVLSECYELTRWVWFRLVYYLYIYTLNSSAVLWQRLLVIHLYIHICTWMCVFISSYPCIVLTFLAAIGAHSSVYVMNTTLITRFWK